MVNYQGTTRTEENLLRELWGHTPSQEIANRINTAAGRGASHPDLRTQAAVTAKARALGLTMPTGRDVSDLTLQGYGDVKLGGILQKEAIAFLYDNYTLPMEQLAQRLGVTIPTHVFHTAS